MWTLSRSTEPNLLLSLSNLLFLQTHVAERITYCYDKYVKPRPQSSFKNFFHLPRIAKRCAGAEVEIRIKLLVILKNILGTDLLKNKHG